MTCRVHWLTGTCALDVDSVLSRVHALSGGLGFEVRPGRMMYRTRYVTVEGLSVLADPLNPDTMPAVCVDVPGAACDALGSVRLQRLAAGLKLTRLDFAWDGAPFTVADVEGWVESGQVRTRARRARAIRPLLDSPGGRTVDLGSRQSSWQLVIYDRRGPVRVEVRFRGARAAGVGELLAAPIEGWSGAFAGRLRGLVDFVERSAGQHPARCPLLPAWSAFVAGAERVVVRLSRGLSATFESIDAWVTHQVAGSLWAWVQGGGSLPALLDHGGRRASSRLRRHARGWVSGELRAMPSALSGA